MAIQDWLAGILRTSIRAKKSRYRKPRRSLRVEMLEDRRLLAVTAYDSSESVLHDQSVSSYVSGYDDLCDPVTFGSMSSPANGSLTFNSDGSFDYTPNAGFVGSDSFDFEVSNGNDTDSGTVTIDVYNTVPEAYDGSDSVLHDQQLYSSVSGYDLDGDAVTFSVTSGVSSGTLNFSGDGSFDYTPNAGFVGTDSFGFDVSDGLASDSATFTINVYNTVPEAYDGSDSVLHDQQLDSSVSGYDLDGDAVTFIVTSGVSNGTLSFSGDGSFDYTPNAGFVGSDSFGFEVSDGWASDSATFTINVYNTAPEANGGSDTFAPNETSFSSADASDSDGDPLTFALTSGTSNGSLTFNSDGTFEYTPNPYYLGPDSFAFEVSDGITSASATHTVEVCGCNFPFAVEEENEPPAGEEGEGEAEGEGPEAPVAPTWTEIDNLPPGALHDGETQWEQAMTYGTKSYQDIQIPDCSEWTIISTATAPNATIEAHFVDGWIWKGSAIPEARLLAHEQLHWTMAVYIAGQFDPILKAQYGEGADTDADFATARSNARLTAANSLTAKQDAIYTLYTAFDSMIQDQYDDETAGGEVVPSDDPDYQVDWQASWQTRIDQEFQLYVQDHPELQAPAE